MYLSLDNPEGLLDEIKTKQLIDQGIYFDCLFVTLRILVYRHRVVQRQLKSGTQTPCIPEEAHIGH